MSNTNNIRNTFNKIVKEARMQWQPGGTWKRSSYVSPLELGQVKYHFLDTQNPDKHVGESAMTRALANLHTDKGDPNNPKAAIVSHPFAHDLKQLHGLAQHHERRMRDAQMYLDKDPLAPKGRFKNDAHAASSFKKWSNHLHTLHSDVMRGLLDAQDKGHQLPEGFKGLTPEHVVNHAAKRGIDVSQPFDSEGFTKKVRDFGRHSRINKMSVDHPLYQGWKTPPAPPAAPAPQVESTTMNKSQRIRAIFENNVSKMQSPEQKEYEAWKLKQHKEKTKSGETAAGIRRGQHVTPGNKADQVYGGRDHMGYLRVSPAQLKGQRLRMSLQHHVDRTKGSNPELAAKYRNLGAKRGMQLASTDHYRAGLRALFEAILEGKGQSPQSKAWGQGMAKGIAQQRDAHKAELERSKKLVAQGVFPPVHTDIVKKGTERAAREFKDSARRGGRLALGKQNSSTNYARAGLRALFETVLDEARGLGSQASKERQGKLERRFDALDKVARKQRGKTVSKGGVTYIGNRPVKTRGEEKVSKERARVALKLEPKVDDRDPNPDPS